MDSTAFTVVAVIAIVVEAFLIFVAFFEPDLEYKVTSPPLCPIDSPEFLRLMEFLTDAKMHRGTRVEVLTNGSTYFDAELEAIRGAQHSVHLEAYIFQKGEVALRFIDALAERARAGVDVRVVLDAVGSFATTCKYLKKITDAGGRVGWYHPFRWSTLPYVNNRTHRELIIVDARIGFIGGSGIADHWLLPKGETKPWRDTMFRVTGDSVAHLQAAFAENWLESTGEILADERFYKTDKIEANTRTMIVDSSPSAGRGTRARILFQTLLASAQKSIHITTPYFLPDLSARREICKAIIERGVEVKIIVPGKHSDHLLTRRSSRRLFGDLLQGGAKIYEYDAAMIHAKILIIDGIWSVVGSTNFDHRSFGLNDEVNLAACCPELATRLEQDFTRDLAHSPEITYDTWIRRPIWERLHESVGSLLERQQ
jgi:cardiolipin synthase